MRTALTYTAILVGTYLVLSYATNGGKLISAGSNAYVAGVKVLQGR